MGLADQRRRAPYRNAVILALCAALFAIWGAAIFLREYRSFYAGAGLAPHIYVTAENAFATLPAGLQSRTREIERCFIALETLRRDTSQPEMAVRGHQACLALADGILASSPAQAGALQLRAEVLLALGDAEGAAAALVLAAQAAPNTMWLMQRRLVLALQLPTPLATPNSAGEAKAGGSGIAAMVGRDIPKLLRLPQARDWLAQLYLAQPNLRPMVAQLDGKILVDDAAAFMQRLRQGVAGQGGVAISP